MALSYRTVRTPTSAEQVIKGSRFICNLGPAPSREHAMREIETVRTRHPKANHVCWAYIAGSPGSAERGQSDDGEPRGTAGKPMLNILDHSGFGEIWTTVTRYFGGIKLGTGGLVRAYSSSVQQALTQVVSLVREPMVTLSITLDYPFLPAVEAFLHARGGLVLEKRFDRSVTLKVDLPESRLPEASQSLSNICSGKIQITPPEINS